MSTTLDAPAIDQVGLQRAARLRRLYLGSKSFSILMELTSAEDALDPATFAAYERQAIEAGN